MTAIRKALTLHVPVVAVILLVALGFSLALGARGDRALERRSRELRRLVLAADAEGEAEAAVAIYRKLDPCPPEVQLRILQRQWGQALERLREIRRARNDLSLQDEVPVLFGQLKDLLEEMNDLCLATLAGGDALGEELHWQVANLQGALKLVSAFAVAETERNAKKATALLREAVAHLKAAVAAVDRVPHPGAARNVPRWNLELLHAEQAVARFQFAEPDTQRELDLADNLQAILPDQGGYAAGEPISRKIRK